jgi:KDO2-lipid IV(A) lauroyltransferase
MTVRDQLSALALGGLLRFFALFPLSAARAFGAALGELAWRGRTRMARRAHANLVRCLPDRSAREIRELARRSVRETGRLAMEVGAVWHWPVERCLALISRVDGAELLEVERGVLILAPHHGNWEMVNLYLGAGDRPFLALYKPPRIGALNQFLRAARERGGSMLAPLNQAGLRRALTLLRHGGMVGILPDQVPAPQGGVVAPWFGQPALTMTLAHRLVRASAVRAVVAVAERDSDGFRLRFRAAPEDFYDADASVSAAALNAAITGIVRCRLPQYQWGYNRLRLVEPIPETRRQEPVFPPGFPAMSAPPSFAERGQNVHPGAEWRRVPLDSEPARDLES